MRRIYCTICAAAVLVTAAGCAASSRVEMDYGTSHRLAIVNQTLDPHAAKNLQPVEGMDGPAAQRAYERHLKGFEKHEPPPTYLLNVGGQGSK